MSFHRTMKSIVVTTPSQVHWSHIKENGLLFSPDEIKIIKSSVEKEPDGRISKKDPVFKDFKPNYGLIKQDGKLYAIYTGKAKLGAGGFGKVKLAQDLETGEWCAIKVPKKNIETKLIKEEFNKLTSVDRQVGTSIIQRIRDNEHTRKKKNSSTQSFLMKYVSGINLKNFIDKRKEPGHTYDLTERECFEIAKGMLTAIIELHKSKKIHRDIKLENFIYDPKTGKVSYIDVGSLETIENEDSIIKKDNEIGTTPGYLSPEALNLEFSIQSDVFALGQTLKELFGIPDKKEEKKPYFAKTPLSDSKDHEQIKTKELRALLKSMTLIEKKSELTMEHALNKFNWLAAEEGEAPPPPFKRAPLQQILRAFEEYSESSPCDIKKLAIVALSSLDFKNLNSDNGLLNVDAKHFQGMDEIVLVQSPESPLSHQELLQVRQSFEAKGMSVRNEILITKDIHQIPQEIAARDKEDKRDILHECFHYKKEPGSKQKSRLHFLAENYVLDEEKVNLKSAITKELNRLNIKYTQTPPAHVQTRYQELARFNKKLDENLTYHELSAELKRVQPTLLKPRFSSLAKVSDNSMFQKKTELYKKIEVIQEKLEIKIK